MLSWSGRVEPRAVILRQLASFSRLIVFDKRGTGMSDRVSGAPTLETRMDDVRAVMDAAGSQRAALVGFSEGAPMSVLFAATYPERTAALVLWGAFARMLVAVGYPMGSSDEEYRRELEADLRLFGTKDEAEEVVRSIGTHDPEAVRLLVDYYRRSASPGAVESLARMNAEIDVRQVLPAIRVPTLVVHGREDRQVPFARGRYLAERIPGARFAPFEGGHVPEGGTATEVVEGIERFLSEVWDAGVWDEVEPERVLSTVLFTDIVGSTESVVELGDQPGAISSSVTKDRPHALVRFRGIELDTAGDGFFASFDGPARAVRLLDRRRGRRDRPRGQGRPPHRRMRAHRWQSSRDRGPHRCPRRIERLTRRGVCLEHGQRPGGRLRNQVRSPRHPHPQGIPGDWQLFAVRRNSQEATPETPAHHPLSQN